MKDASTGNRIASRHGVALIELLFAFAIFLMAVVGVTSLAFGSQSLSVDSSLHNEALQRATIRLSEAQETVRTDFAANITDSVSDDGFTETVEVFNETPFRMRITSMVEWMPSPDRPLNVAFTTVVTDWERALDEGGDIGGAPPSGDWRFPLTIETLDIGTGNQANDVDVLMRNGTRIAYLATEHSDIAKSDLFLVNVTDPYNASLISGLDIGNSLNALDAAGDYVYLAGKNTTAQLLVADVKNPAVPTLIATTSLPGAQGVAALSIFYSGGYAYVGTAKTSGGPEFHVVDVSNPASPVPMGSFEIDAGVRAIVVRNDRAYLATGRSGSEFLVLDVSNPLDVSIATSFNIPGNRVAKSLTIVGNIAYLGCLWSGSGDDFFVLDLGNGGAPTLLSSMSIKGDVNDIAVAGGLAFLVTKDANFDFKVLNVADPSAITPWGRYNFPQVAAALDYEDNLIYAAVRSNEALRIIGPRP